MLSLVEVIKWNILIFFIKELIFDIINIIYKWFNYIKWYFIFLFNVILLLDVNDLKN